MDALSFFVMNTGYDFRPVKMSLIALAFRYYPKFFTLNRLHQFVTITSLYEKCTVIVANKSLLKCLSSVVSL